MGDFGSGAQLLEEKNIEQWRGDSNTTTFNVPLANSSVDQAKRSNIERRSSWEESLGEPIVTVDRLKLIQQQLKSSQRNLLQLESSRRDLAQPESMNLGPRYTSSAAPNI